MVKVGVLMMVSGLLMVFVVVRVSEVSFIFVVWVVVIDFGI